MVQRLIGMIDWLKYVKTIGLCFHFSRKHFYSRKQAYHAQSAAVSLTEKGNEIVRHFAPPIVENLVKQGWCNENLSTITSYVTTFSQVVSRKNSWILFFKVKLSIFPVP